VTTLKDIFDNQMAAYEAGDVDALLDSFSEDCVLQDMADPDNSYTGQAEIKEFLDDYFSTLIDATVGRTVAAAEGDTIVGELDVSATYVGEPFSRENAREVKLRYCVIERVRDGKVCFERFYWDSAALERQLA
jgi:ketosteroid isomerase-like protein